MTRGILYLVSTPIGNLADLSQRALATLEAVAVVYAEDTRHSGNLLRQFGLRKPVRSLHEHNEVRRIREVIDRLADGENLALVTDAGTPTISDPGVRVVAAAAEAGFRVEPVPGPSAVMAALSVSGLVADRFLFLGFAPRRGRQREVWMDQALEAPHTVVAFEAPGRLGALLGEWESMGAGARGCVVCRELTKLYEEVRHGTVAALADYYSGEEVRGEVTVVLEGRPRREDGEDVDEDEAALAARDMAGKGESTRRIARRLQGEFGMTRNRAYEMALRVVEGK
jgi:16S rRNA (cytidine1402-2'-O)-methyltransferase